MKVLFGVRKGREAWREEVLCTQPERFDEVKIQAAADGFGRFRIANISEGVPDFAGTVRGVQKSAATAKKKKLNRVEVCRQMIGLDGMQVCAEGDATDAEILAVCNGENPSGTKKGWSIVIRKSRKKNALPVPCEDHKGRTHFLVLC